MSISIRAEHIGSFLRPAELLEARSQLQADPERVRALEDVHIKCVISRQKELGFQVFTDGETRRRNFMSDFTEAVAGFDLADATARSWYSELDVPPGKRERQCQPGKPRNYECKPRYRRRDGKAPAGPAAYRTRTQLSAPAQPGPHQNDPAQRYAVSGNFV
jgi:hypothetical protein